MVVLHSIDDFINSSVEISNSFPTYFYEGRCITTGNLLRLPRTPLIEAIAHGLMKHLAQNECYAQEGKMYGVLLVELQTGEQRVIKAFSGLLQGQSIVEGWIPLIPGREDVAKEETQTLAILEQIKQELITLTSRPEPQQYSNLCREFEQQLQSLSDRHLAAKQQRHILRASNPSINLEQLNEESRQEGIERRNLKRRRNEVLKSLKQQVEAIEARIRELKQQRKTLSRQLQSQMHSAYSLTNFSGQSFSLQQLLPKMPTGTGDCCAPKLLHYAATHHLKPLAMAEFWWGSTQQDKVQGEFYEACVERCQPLMGFLLSGLSYGMPMVAKQDLTLPILYEDEWLVVVDKPSGLLSVPGRYFNRQDSVLLRLRHLLPEGESLMLVHRLDEDTSGILLVAKNIESYHLLSKQFQQRQVDKVYEAILSGTVIPNSGVIELPLSADINNRPSQKVDWQQGKASVTSFQVLAREGNYTRVEFIPLTGRTHQLRIHAANEQGLAIPILGDRLYGCRAIAKRLHLHAKQLTFQHPQSSEKISLSSPVPF